MDENATAAAAEEEKLSGMHRFTAPSQGVHFLASILVRIAGIFLFRPSSVDSYRLSRFSHTSLFYEIERMMFKAVEEFCFYSNIGNSRNF